MNRTKVVLVGWDAADWKVINDLVSQGLMPTMERLINNGTIGNISTLDPPFSPMLWTTIATGKYPFKHGILGFTEPNPDMRGIRPISSKSRKVKALWNILNQNGFRTNILNWWPSHPAEHVDGFMISNFYKAIKSYDFTQLPKGTVYPGEFSDFFNHLRMLVPEISAEMLSAFVPNIRQIADKEQRRLSAIAENIATTQSVHNAATWLAENTSWDFFAVYFDLIDHLSHGFMQFYPPKLPHVSDEDFENFNFVVKAAYIYQDYMLGHFLDIVGNDVNLVLVSDHGFHSDHLRPKEVPLEPAGPAYQHREYGIILLHGPLFKKDERIYGASLLDITPTILHAYGLPIGEDMDGVPLVNAFNREKEIKTIDSWEKVTDNEDNPDNDTLSNYDQAETLQQLIELGYIEEPDDDAFVAAKKTQDELNYNLARSYMFANMYDKAAPILQNLFEANPHSARFARRLITCYRHLNKTNKAQEALDKFKLAAQNNFEQLKEELGKKKKSKDNKVNEETIKLYRKTVTAGKDIIWSILAEAELLADKGETKLALDKALEIEQKTKPSPGIYTKIAEFYLAGNQTNKAIEYLHKALELDPENHIALYRLGAILYAKGNLDQALDYVLRSLSLVYYNYQGQYLLGQILYKSGEYKRAALALEVALLIAPNLTNARLLLIDIYNNNLNEPQKAQKHTEFMENPDKFAYTTSGQTTLAHEEIRVKPSKQGKRENNYDNIITVVSGVPRSGTSLMMQILEKAGIEPFTDGNRSSDTNNPKGYYEHQAVKKLYKSADFLNEIDNKAVKIISYLLEYLPDNNYYKIIFMERDLDEIVRSQQKMIKHISGKDRTYRYTQVKNTLRIHLKKIKQYLAAKNNMEVLYINYNELLIEPDGQIDRIIDFLQLDRKKRQNMISAVDSNLYRTKNKSKY